MSRVWLITGCSSGFGREIALAAARNGDRVVATARDISKIEDLEQKHPQLIIRKRLDVLDRDEQMRDTIKDIIDQVGKVDVLVNNAGYILEGAIEECSSEEVQMHFSTNVFGQLNVLRAVIPYMRARRSGTIANMGSMVAWTGTPSTGLYSATKAAVAMYTESLRAEVAPFNIDVTCIEPGTFRTNFLQNGHRIVAKSRIPELAPVTDRIKDALDAYDKKQPGDPQKGAEVIVQALTKTGVCEGRTLPARLALGKDAVAAIGQSISRNKKDLDDWADIVSTTNCSDAD
ncbi:hypothetical protein GX51_05971 [Blastomyces parvus]|uniref:Uncharacterized protein n=1 Tax=Blastomyces parvus TaxID=2060905 RepID=A0A2B7WUM5_9EURO|nr:hypothetical protein GX51_05971 [Blastomyces parvus]